MDSPIQKTRSVLYYKLYSLGEILLVFLMAYLFIRVMNPWTGEDPIRGFIVLWLANVLMLTMIWIGMRLRGESWKDFGLTFARVRFREGLRIFGLSLLVFVIAITGFLMAPVLMALITEVPESANFSSYDFLKDNLGWLFLSLAGVYIVSSFGEEVVYRAFLINRISGLVKSTRYHSVIAVILSSIFFGLAHYQWGPMGMVQTGFMGLALGICYIKLNKKLWVLIFAHAYMDTILLVQVYMASN